MIDWNGNGIIDPLDIGLSIAMQDEEIEEEEPEDEEYESDDE